MNAEQLVHEVHNLMPQASEFEIMQMAYLVSVDLPDGDDLTLDALAQNVHEIQLRLKAASDQFAAVAHELSTIGRFDPCKFSPEQLWSLLRSIKVHSQLLQIYTKRPQPSSAA